MINVLELVMTGLCVGVGSALGLYFANKGLIKQLEKILSKLNNNRRKNVKTRKVLIYFKA